MSDITEKNSTDSVKKPRYSVKAPSRGGARTGAGRKKGQTSKVSYVELLKEIDNTFGMSYAQLVILEIQKSIIAGDTRLTKDYLDLIGKKAIADKSEMDVTSNGETLGTVINLVQAETGQYNKPE